MRAGGRVVGECGCTSTPALSAGSHRDTEHGGGAGGSTRGPGGIAARSWGERNSARIAHPISRAVPAFVARWLDMPPDPLPGDSNMPRVQSADFGASERFAVMPGREAQGYFMMPGGQGGHPLSPWYGAGHADWVRGTPTPFLPGPTQHVLRFSP